MSAIIHTLDSYTETPLCVGENNHSAYSWSNDCQEKIVQFHFQLVRTTDNQLDVLAQVLRDLLRSLSIKPSSQHEVISRLELLNILYCILGQTRDIVDGKGEYTLAYMMILVWYEFFPELALFALETFVLGEMDPETKVCTADFHPYGSWKDMKYFALYCRNQGCASTHPLIQRVIRLTNIQLYMDNYGCGGGCSGGCGVARLADCVCLTATSLTSSTSTPISLAAKWVPRQSSGKFGWLNTLLALDYFKDVLETAKTSDKFLLAKKKCFMLYRKMLSRLNTHLDTIQIKQCAGSWSTIDHAKTTSITFMKQSKALYNVNKDGSRRSHLPDRVECASKLTEFVAARIASGKEIKGGRVSMLDFSKRALEMIESRKTLRHNTEFMSQVAMLNSQWRDSSTSTGALTNFVAMVDTSSSMTWDGSDPFYAALSLGIRVAEKSSLGKRVLTFSAYPTWVRLDGCDDYIDMVEILKKADAGMNTNFYAALDMILTALVENKVPAEDANKMCLVIFSDMQIDQGDENYVSMYAGIEQKYRLAGYEKPPHILFWNLKSGRGAPTLASQTNVTTMSGFSPALLNQFCELGMEGLASATPWTMLVESLDKPRYEQLTKYLKMHI